jgi:hypothetical protein
MMETELQHLKIDINDSPGSLLVEYKKGGNEPGQNR